MAKKLNITPLHDRVVVKPAPAEEKTAGGIIIPDTAKEKPQRGTVVAAGPVAGIHRALERALSATAASPEEARATCATPSASSMRPPSGRRRRRGARFPSDLARRFRRTAAVGSAAGRQGRWPVQPSPHRPRCQEEGCEHRRPGLPSL